MIRNDEANFLVSLLSNETDTLNEILEEFNGKYDFKDRIWALTASSLLLLDGLLNHKQQFVAVWILYSSYDFKLHQNPSDQKISYHPFYSVFKSIFDCFSSKPNIYSPQTCSLITCILGQEDLNFISNCSILQIYGKNFSFPQPKLTTIEDSDIFERISPLLVSNNENNLNSNANNFSDSNENKNVLSHDEVLIKILQEESFYSNFKPIFIRPIPDVLPIFHEELNFIDSPDNPPFILDDGFMSNNRQETIELLKKSLIKKLRLNEADTLINQLKKDDGSILEEAQIPNTKISSLIENNCEVAKYVIQGLMPKKPSVLKILSGIEVSAASVDVIKHILTTVPEQSTREFTDNYIANATKYILSIKDSPTMLRKARIFSKMIGFIVQNGYKLNPSSIFEMNSFCEEPKIRDLKEAKDINEILLSS